MMLAKWTSHYWKRLSSLPVLVLVNCCVLLASADNTSQAYYTALINVTVLNPDRVSPTLLRIDRGRYGQDSPKVEVKGLLLAPVPINGVVDRLGCDPRTRFHVPPNTKQWIALLQRGNCTFREKILRAASHNATAVVIYNNISSEEPVTMTHQGLLAYWICREGTSRCEISKAVLKNQDDSWGTQYCESRHYPLPPS